MDDPEIERVVIASFAQETTWLAAQLKSSGPAYHVPYRLWLTGEVRPAELRDALRDVVGRHEALRTSLRYRDGALHQVVRRRADVALPVVDLRSEVDAAASAGQVAQAEVQRPFDLEAGPLLRATLLRLADDRYHLLLVIHHLVFDGWSRTILLDELTEAYCARVIGRPPRLAPLPVQYADFARWQRDRADEPGWSARSLDYWRRQLDGAPQLLRLPPSGGATPGASGGAPATGADGRHVVSVPADLAEAVRALARGEGCTLFVVLLAGFAALLRAQSGQNQLLVGTPAADRPRPEVAGLIGLFVTMLPIRVDFDGARSYRQLVRRLSSAILAGYEHQVPLERILAEVRPHREPGRSPLFQAVFWMQSRPAGPPRLHGLDVEVEELFTGVAKYDLTLGVRETESGLDCELTYRATVLGPAAARRVAEDYLGVLRQLTADPEGQVAVPTVPAPDAATESAPGAPTGAGSGPPATALEHTIADVWRSVLGVPSVGLHDNFFDLGGHSRLMVEVRDRLAGAVDRRLSLLDLFEYPTVSALARHLVGPGANDVGSPGQRSEAAGAEVEVEQRRAARLRLGQGKGRGPTG